MGRQEKLFEWFKCLPAHKRIDYMCGLLRLCLPLELRFLGSVLENLARKDFHSLRDQENKANLRSDLSANTSSSLSDKKLRAKIITALALMNPSNSPCAQVIFDIIIQQLQDTDGLLKQSHSSPSLAADLIMMLTMAVNHPAFTFYQRTQLGLVLQRVQRYMGEPSGDDSGDAEDQNVHVYTSAVPHGFCQSGYVEQQTVSEGHTPYCSCERPQMSGISSPVNSRTSSPSSVSSHTDARCRLAGVDTAAPPTACPADHTFQLLHLSLDDYCSGLRDDPLQQVIHTNREEYARAGLPPELEVKLKSKLGQGRSPCLNGVVDGARLSWTPASAVFYQPFYNQPLAHYIPQVAHMPGYVAPSRHMSVPPGHIRPGQGSAGSSQTPSPPTSPQLQPGAGQPADPAAHLPSSLDLHLVSPAGTVAMDTQNIPDVGIECAESCSSEDEKPPPGHDQTGKYKRRGTAQQSQSLPVISQDTVVLPSLEAAKRTSMLPAPVTHPYLLTAAESETRTPPPQPALGVSPAGSHIPSTLVGLVNGYLCQPAPVQGAPSAIGPRGILHSRTPAAVQQQPVHSGLHRHNQAMPLPDAQQWYASLVKNGASLSEHPAGLPLHSLIPFAASTPMMILSPANFQLSAAVPLPAQSLSSVPVMPDGSSSSYSGGGIPQPQDLHTSMASSSLVGTTPSHPSPTPSPAVYVDQLQPLSYVMETTDPIRGEESSVSPPAQTPSVVTGLLKSHSDASSSSSGTPSPPLMPASHRHSGSSDAQRSWRAPNMLRYFNSYVPVIIPGGHHQQQQHTFPPNGLMPECGTFVPLHHHTQPGHLFPPQTSPHTTVSPKHLYSPHTIPPTTVSLSHVYSPQTVSPSHMYSLHTIPHTTVSPSHVYPPHTTVSPSPMYSPQTIPHTTVSPSHVYSPHTIPHTTVSPSDVYSPHTTVSPSPMYSPHTSPHTAVSPSHVYSPHTSPHIAVSPSQGSTATNIACYNCGYTGHQVSDCPESRMEAVSNTFHLSYNPST